MGVLLSTMRTDFIYTVLHKNLKQVDIKRATCPQEFYIYNRHYPSPPPLALVSSLFFYPNRKSSRTCLRIKFVQIYLPILSAHQSDGESDGGVSGTVPDSLVIWLRYSICKSVIHLL
jgi:hypothetical protein